MYVCMYVCMQTNRFCQHRWARGRVPESEHAPQGSPTSSSRKPPGERERENIPTRLCIPTHTYIHTYIHTYTHTFPSYLVILPLTPKVIRWPEHFCVVPDHNLKSKQYVCMYVCMYECIWARFLAHSLYDTCMYVLRKGTWIKCHRV